MLAFQRIYSALRPEIQQRLLKGKRFVKQGTVLTTVYAVRIPGGLTPP